MALIDIVRILGGLVLLVGGGEALVRGASSLATRIGISSLIVGLTVVSVATSAPEFAVTLDAVLRDRPHLAVGNVVGSNIANVLLVLGVASLVAPVIVRRRLVTLDLPVMIGLSLLLFALGLDGTVSPLDGGIVLALFVTHMAIVVVRGRRAAPNEHPHETHDTATADTSTDGTDTHTDDTDDTDAAALRPLAALAFVAVGTGLLVGGATLLVDGAVNIATAFGVSQLVIGLTIVAIGTSLPELAASVIAVRRGERDLAVGNVVGSNIANIGLVLGLPALIGGGIPVPTAAIALDIPLMIAAALALLPVAYTGYLVHRLEGALFVGLYLAYTGYVLLDSTNHDALEGFTTMMLWFVLPTVGATLLVHGSYEFVTRRSRPAHTR